MAFAAADNQDFFNLNGGKRSIVENVTSHKIAVVAFIREFCLLKRDAQDMMVFDYTMSPKYRKDFCMLVLKLIQSPDLEFRELEALLTSGNYNLLSSHLQNFCLRLKQIYDDGVNALVDCVSQAVDRLMVEETPEAIVFISKSSVAGIFIRRMMVFLDKLSFSQVTSVYRSFCSYYESGRPGSLMRCLSKDKLDTSESATDILMTSEEKKFFMAMENSRKKINFDSDSGFEHCQWSRKQAELVTARQAALLQGGEPRALSPPQLQDTISQILRDNPDFAEAHFLSYLNCLRSRELCGAMDSLYSCFDRSVATPLPPNTTAAHYADRNRVFRYASLNLAILHAQFGHKEQCLSALKEAMVMSQEAGDSACLQQAACWAWRAGGGGGGPPRAPLPATGPAAPATAPPARHRAALAAQAFVQHAVTRKATPAHLFGLMMKGDVVHCQNSMTDLMQTSLANRAALWAFYGKSQMASICCQLLLNLNTGGEWDCEAACLAACGTAINLALSGHKSQAAAVLQHARFRAPSPPHSRIWMRTQHLITAQYALMSGKWQEAEQAAHQLASIDRWESQLIKAEIHFLKGEPVYAMTCLNDVLDFCRSEEESQLYLPIRIKAMVLAAQIENSCTGVYKTSSTNITLLNEALSLAVDNYLDYQAAIIEMHVANVQLQLGCVTNALAIVQRVLATVMAHGGPFDQGRAMLLYVKCRIASAPKSGEIRKKVMILCSDLLETVKKKFNQVEAISRLKDVIYLQAQVHHEIGNTSGRNKCASEYRQLDEQHPTKLSNTLLTCF